MGAHLPVEQEDRDRNPVGARKGGSGDVHPAGAGSRRGWGGAQVLVVGRCSASGQVVILVQAGSIPVDHPKPLWSSPA